ncbi:small ribosomal subunit protein uS2-like [Saimiri boliviensis]|uniref:small ribosomal subunit protein uS2-like n=1 Tax=Saimiri boliviensis TaxID=27679 RepID=UPI003D77506B
MSGALDVLQMKEDVLKFLAAGTQLGGTHFDFQMEQYIYKRKSDGIYIINPKRTWEKLLLAACVIVAIENSADVSVIIFSRNTGQRVVLKFVATTGATPIAGRFTPGSFTNQIQAASQEPWLLVVTDPRADHQPLMEASYVTLPTIALCNTDSPLGYVDIAIPCNKFTHSVGLMWWMLAWEVLCMRGTISHEHRWEVMTDLYFNRDPEETEKEEQAAEKAVTKEEFQGEWTAPAPEFTASQPEVADWSEGMQVPSAPVQQFPTED